MLRVKGNVTVQGRIFFSFGKEHMKLCPILYIPPTQHAKFPSRGSMPLAQKFHTSTHTSLNFVRAECHAPESINIILSLLFISKGLGSIGVPVGEMTNV